MTSNKWKVTPPCARFEGTFLGVLRDFLETFPYATSKKADFVDSLLYFPGQKLKQLGNSEVPIIS